MHNLIGSTVAKEMMWKVALCVLAMTRVLSKRICQALTEMQKSFAERLAEEKKAAKKLLESVLRGRV